jgi:ubiquinone/menaquinone biosynthesis C-methylase UbiE
MEEIMSKARIVETDSGIEGEFNVAIYDNLQRKLRDRGWIETNDIIHTGITEGLALEIGPGPGYLGLEWLKNTEGTRLKGLDISADMIAIAERNAQEYGLRGRVEYVRSSGDKMPFENSMFDAVFTNGSLHEWAHPKNTLNEIWRVLKPGGRFFVSDMRRDMFILMKWFLYIAAKPKEIRPGLISSINAAYTPDELKDLLKDTKLADCEVTGNMIGLMITGKK